MSRKANARTRHHRKPQSKGGGNEKRNIAIIRRCEHQSWHNLFGTKNPDEIAEIINGRFIDPDYMLVCKRRWSILRKTNPLAWEQ